ncbi:hypothetical protein JCM5296_003412 [Sporobolomyces johnsonii]
MPPAPPSTSALHVDVQSSLRARRTTSGAREDEQTKGGHGGEVVSWSRYFRKETAKGGTYRKYSTPWRLNRAQGTERAMGGGPSARPSQLPRLSPPVRQPFEPFLPEHVGSQTVKLSKPRRGYRVSSLCLGTFNEQTFDEFIVERNAKLVQGVLGVNKGKTSEIALSGYGFQGHSAILLTFPAGSISALYFGPIKLVTGHDGQQLERVDLVIQTSYTPTFAAYCSTLANREATRHVRVSAFDKEHHRLVPFLSRHFLLTLELPVSPPHAAANASPLAGSLDDLLASTSFTSDSYSLPSPLHLPLLNVLCARCHYSEHELSSLSTELAMSVSPALAFPLEWIVRDGTLTPHEVRDLVSDHVVPWETTASYGEDVAEDILYELRTQLVEEREKRAGRIRRGDDALEESRGRARGVDVAREAERARRKVVEERERVKLLDKEEDRDGGREEGVRTEGKGKGKGRKGGIEDKVRRTHYWSRSVVVTPSGTIKFQGRLLDKTNAVIRQHFDGVDHFLRVTFKDEDGLQLSSVCAGVAGEAMGHLIEGSITKTLKKGLKLGGRTYEMLSYSQSSLRDHSVLFLAPFESDRIINGVREERITTAHEVRQSMGDFEKVSYQPAKLGARWSQGFTATHASQVLHFGSIRGIPDLVETDEQGNEVTNHTDGAGIISPDLRDMIWRALLDNGFRRDQSAPPPSVFQIRLGGSKGAVAVDNQLDGIVIALRPSQDKYLGKVDDEATESYVLNVADAFTRPGRLRLNPPLVSALDDLGVRTEVFLDYLQLALDDLQLEEDQFVFDKARTLLIRHSFGGASRLTSLLGSLARLQTVPFSLLTDEPFLRLAMNVVRTRIKRDLKYKAAIPLPDCFVLVGVPDEDRFLEENQIYAALRDPNKPDEVRYLRGRIAMTRSPTIDPGDIRIVEAVGELPEGHELRMRSLENCVVLPTVGQRALSSMQGGGDLDGDTYQLITIPALIPEETVPPRSHEAVPPVELDHPATSDDVADCFVNYLTNNTLGRIAITHLRLADVSPQHGFDPWCRHLADLHSQAVDAPKTGRVVPLADIPSTKSNKRPDFLRKAEGDFYETSSSGAKYYESARALGFIFRAISDNDVRAPDALKTDEPVCSDSSSSSFHHLRLVVERNLETLLELPPSQLVAGAAARRDEVTRVRSGFCSSFKHLATVFAFPRTRGQRLSEAEVFAVANLTEADREHAARGHAVAAMGQQMSSLVEWLKFRLGSGPEGLSRLYSAWVLGLGGEDQEFGVKSFRWICLALLLEAMKDAEEERERGEELGRLARTGRQPRGSTSSMAFYSTSSTPYDPPSSGPLRPSFSPPLVSPTACSTPSLERSSSSSPSPPSSSRVFRSLPPTRTIARPPSSPPFPSVASTSKARPSSRTLEPDTPSSTSLPPRSDLFVTCAPDPWAVDAQIGHHYGFEALRGGPPGLDADSDGGNSSDSSVGGLPPAFPPLPPPDYKHSSLAPRYVDDEQGASSSDCTASMTSAERIACDQEEARLKLAEEREKRLGWVSSSQTVSYAAHRSVRKGKERAKEDKEEASQVLQRSKRRGRGGKSRRGGKGPEFTSQRMYEEDDPGWSARDDAAGPSQPSQRPLPLSVSLEPIAWPSDSPFDYHGPEPASSARPSPVLVCPTPHTPGLSPRDRPSQSRSGSDPSIRLDKDVASHSPTSRTRQPSQRRDRSASPLSQQADRRPFSPSLPPTPPPGAAPPSFLRPYDKERRFRPFRGGRGREPE